VLRFLSSTRLTIALCLALAAVGVAGSFLYDGATASATRGAGNVFHSPLFYGPVFLLVLNVCCCVWSRLAAGAFRGERAFLFVTLHAGLVLLAAGMIIDGRYAFLGTQYYRLSEPSPAHFDWRDNTEKTFPFAVEVTGVTERYHPMKLQVGVKDPDGRKRGPYLLHEGGSFRVPDTGLEIVPRRFDIAAKTLTFDVSSGGKTVTGVRADADGAEVPGGFRVVPVAWADPEMAEFVARVRFHDPGKAPVDREIRMNRPARHEGILFCLSDARSGADGSRLVGLQMTREPGSPLFWAGGLIFGAALLGGIRRKLRERPAEKPEGETFGIAVVALTLALSTAACLLPGSALAFGRSVVADESWSGEVKILEPVIVEKGATLTIRPGTVVRLSGESRGEPGVPDGGIQVFGRLRVEGDPANPVLFERLDPARPWGELFCKDADVIVRHAVFRGALWGMHIHDGNVSIVRTVFRGNGGGARLRGTGTRFDRCTISGNDIGLRFWDGGPRITGSAIEGNGVGLFYRDGAGGGKIDGCRIANREVDAKIGDWARGDLDLSGNWWGGGRPKLRDFRGDGPKGKIPTSPVLKRAPVAGAE
jgi:hypothetical protein